MSRNGTFKLNYTTNSDEFDLEDGLTVRAAWLRYAADLGGNADRPVVFRAGGVLISGDAKIQPGQEISATVTQEAKGL